jgi:hypothetical protein
MYLVSDQGVLLYTAIDKHNECHPVKDIFEDFKPSGLTDLSRDGLLLVDLKSVNTFQEGSHKYQIRKYKERDLVASELSDG